MRLRYAWCEAVIENQPEVLMRYPTSPVSHKGDVHARRMAKASVVRGRVVQRASFQASFGALTARAQHHYSFSLCFR